MKNSLLLFLATLCLFSCENKSASGTDDDATAKPTESHNVVKNVADTTYVDVKGNKYQYLGVIPDSLRTPEQKQLIKLINEVSFKYMSVENNHMVFKLTREEYLAKGIPERYYDLLLKNIQDNNLFFDANGIKNVDKMINETREQLLIPE